MLFLGPSDISASIGHMLDLANPDVIKLIEKAERRMRKTGKLMGTVIRPGKTLNWTFERGYDLVIGGADFRLLQNAANAQVQGFRDNPPKRRAAPAKKTAGKKTTKRKKR